MKHAEAEGIVRGIARTCRGPRRKELTPADFKAMGAELRDALMISGAPPTDCADIVGHYISELLFNSWKKQAGDLDELARQGCGMDFNNIVLANSLDGEVHDYECPSCHVTGIYRAPRFEIEEVAP